MDSYHRHDVMCDLRNDLNPEFYWTREPLRLNGQALSAMEMMKKRKLLNTATAKVLSCSSLLAVLHCFVAYERPFIDSYEVSFVVAR